MRPPNDTREAPASCRDLLGAAGCLSIAGPISTALVASTNPIQLAAAPSHSTAQTGIDIRGLTIHANGIRQYYLEAGSGPPVVLLHGFPETNYSWRYQIPVLARQHRVIAPDLRGYGETDKPASGYDKRNGTPPGEAVRWGHTTGRCPTRCRCGVGAARKPSRCRAISQRRAPSTSPGCGAALSLAMTARATRPSGSARPTRPA